MDDQERESIRRMDAVRDINTTTCPASRHSALCAEEPGHVGLSIATTVAALWEARAFLDGLGYTWEIGADRKSRWIKKGEGD
jgi:hypothetical protein